MPVNEAEERTYELVSAGRSLVVRANSALFTRWVTIAPHLPGVLPDGLRLCCGARPIVVRLGEGIRVGDARRLLNAHLHLLHLVHGTLCLHAVALRHPADGRVVLLLGGHGAGKTLVALALFKHGWRVMAGDVALVDCSTDHMPPSVVGGTAAFLARTGPTRRWFPDLTPASGQAHMSSRMDLSHLPGLRESLPVEPGRVTVALLVDVDGDRMAGAGTVEALEDPTAATVWWRASGHLLERLLDDDQMVLRQLEDSATAAHRLSRVRALAREIPLYAVWGAPEAIADRIEQLAQVGMPEPVTEVG